MTNPLIYINSPFLILSHGLGQRSGAGCPGSPLFLRMTSATVPHFLRHPTHWFESSLLTHRIPVGISGENLLSKMTDTNSVREPTFFCCQRTDSFGYKKSALKSSDCLKQRLEPRPNIPTRSNLYKENSIETSQKLSCIKDALCSMRSFPSILLPLPSFPQPQKVSRLESSISSAG